MNKPSQNARLLTLAVVLLCALALPGGAQAQFTLTPTITNLPGGLFRYDYSVNNMTLFEYSAFSITVIPAPETVQSLAVPTGFNGFFDSGLGQVDFIEDTLTFPAGATVSGFAFSSPFAPRSSPFTATRLDAGGNPVAFTGSVLAPAVPEPATILLLASGLASLASLRFRRREVAQ